MPFAKFLYEQYHRSMSGTEPKDYVSFWGWDKLPSFVKQRWEDYARCIAAYFAP